MVEQHIRIGPAAKLLGVSVATLRNWDKSGRLRPGYLGPGAIRYYRLSDLEALVAGQPLATPAEQPAPRDQQLPEEGS